MKHLTSQNNTELKRLRLLFQKAKERKKRDNIGQKTQNLSMLSLGKKIKKIFRVNFIHNKKQEDKRSYKVDFSKLYKRWNLKPDNLKLELKKIYKNIK